MHKLPRRSFVDLLAGEEKVPEWFSSCVSPSFGTADQDLAQKGLVCYLGLGPELPEDLYHLIKKAVAVRKHLEPNRKDKDSKFRLILIESRIHRISRYYKRAKQLPAVWK